jgi:16S rRNA (adenine(1408)-N(1))-methyltransferase
MVEASRRAVRKGALPNALFVVAAAESLPPELHGFADEVTIHFPWASLLRGLVRADPVIVQGLLAMTKPVAEITLLLSLTARDRRQGLGTLDGRVVEDLCRGMATFGLRVQESRPASARDLEASHSSWAKRLGVGAARTAWLLRLERGSASLLRNSPTVG